MPPRDTVADRESFDPFFFKILFEAEDRHFWFRARNEIIGTMVRQMIGSFPAGFRVLEVGCGTGNVLRVLERICAHGTVIGMDLFEEGLRFASQRTACSLVVGDVHSPPFSAPFDLIGMFDVLEHLVEDVEVLRAVGRMLAPGRMLLLTVPAHPELWGYFDEAACHCRRYRVHELTQKLTTAGFKVEFVTEFMAGLYPLVWAGRRWASWTQRGSADPQRRNQELSARELRIIPIFNGFMSWLLSRETRWLLGRRRLPVGTSILAVARTSASSV